MVIVLRFEANNKVAEKQFCKRAVQLLRYVKPLEKSGKLLLCSVWFLRTLIKLNSLRGNV
jgi:hypothetical protein